MRFIVALLTAGVLCGCVASKPTRDEVAVLDDADLCARMYYSDEYGVGTDKRYLGSLREEFDKRFQEQGLQPGYCKVLAVRQVNRDGLI